MKKEPCKCCQQQKSSATSGADGYGYNRLEGEAMEWAKENQIPRSEFCVPVKGGRRLGGPDWLNRKCGNGRMGFTTRRKNQSETRMEVGLDGQYKKSRHTTVRRKSAMAVRSRRPRRVDGSRCSLVPSITIVMAMRDPIVVAQQKRVYKKMKRARNRNNRARRGHRLARNCV